MKFGFGGDVEFPRHGIAPFKIKPFACQFQPQHLCHKTAAPIIAGSNSWFILKGGDAFAQRFGGHCADRNIDRAWKVSGGKIPGIAGVDNLDIASFKHLFEILGVQQAVFVVVIRQRPQVRQRTDCVVAEIATLYYPFFQAAGDKAAIDPHFGKFGAGFRAAISVVTKQHNLLARSYWNRLFEIWESDVLRSRQGAHFPFTGFPYVKKPGLSFSKQASSLCG